MVFLVVMLHSLLFLPLRLKEGYLSMRRLGGSGLEAMHTQEVKSKSIEVSGENVTKEEQLNILYFGKPRLIILVYSKEADI